MTVDRDYASILANLSRHRPIDMDNVLFDTPKSTAMSAPCASPFPVSSVLWKMHEQGYSYIGLRITKPIEAPETLAVRLCAIALERQVHPIFLSYIAHSGMQQYGFRVEQLMGLTELAQQQFEQQLQKFWQLALVINASEIGDLG